MKLFKKIKTFFKKTFSKKDDENIQNISNEEKKTEEQTTIIDEFLKQLNDSSTLKLLPKEITKVEDSSVIVKSKKRRTKKQVNLDNIVPQKKSIEVKKEKIEKQIFKSTNPKYNKIVVFLTPGHTNKTPGKHSPDGKLYEWKYNRIIVEQIEKQLDKLGIEHWNSHPEDSWVDKSHNTDNKDLQLRVQRINNKYEEVKKQGKTAIMLSIHVNAAGNGDWKNATGWSAWTTKGQNNSDKLAECLYEAAEELIKPLGKKLRYDLTDGDKDFESNFYVIKHVNCIAVLTENFFMDNKNDVEWLLSKMGQKYITLIHIEGIKKYIEKYIK